MPIKTDNEILDELKNVFANNPPEHYVDVVEKNAAGEPVIIKKINQFAKIKEITNIWDQKSKTANRYVLYNLLLGLAVEHNYLEIVKVLMHWNSKPKDFLADALYQARRLNNDEMVKFLEEQVLINFLTAFTRYHTPIPNDPRDYIDDPEELTKLIDLHPELKAKVIKFFKDTPPSSTNELAGLEPIDYAFMLNKERAIKLFIGDYPIHQAIRKNDLARLVQLIKDDPIGCLNQKMGALGILPIHVAARYSPRILDYILSYLPKYLVNSGIREYPNYLEAPDSKGQTSLSYAMIATNDDSFNFLIGLNANPNVKALTLWRGKTYMMPLMARAFVTSNNTAVLTLNKLDNLDLSQTFGQESWTTLHTVRFDYVRNFKWISHMLGYAAYPNMENVLTVPVNPRFNLLGNEQGTYPATIIYFRDLLTSFYDSPDNILVAYMLLRGDVVPLDTKNKAGDTFLHILAKNPKFASHVVAFQMHEYLFDIPNNNGETPRSYLNDNAEINKIARYLAERYQNPDLEREFLSIVEVLTNDYFSKYASKERFYTILDYKLLVILLDKYVKKLNYQEQYLEPVAGAKKLSDIEMITILNEAISFTHERNYSSERILNQVFRGRLEAQQEIQRNAGIAISKNLLPGDVLHEIQLNAMFDESPNIGPDGQPWTHEGKPMKLFGGEPLMKRLADDNKATPDEVVDDVELINREYNKIMSAYEQRKQHAQQNAPAKPDEEMQNTSTDKVQTSSRPKTSSPVVAKTAETKQDGFFNQRNNTDGQRTPRQARPPAKSSPHPKSAPFKKPLSRPSRK